MKELLETEVAQSFSQPVSREIDPLDLVRNSAWRKVYQTIRAEYGTMSPKEFVLKVLFRFRGSEKLRERFLEIIGEEPKEFNEKAVIDNEVVEIILSNLFLQEEVRLQIVSRLFDDEATKKIKEEFGFFLSHVPEDLLKDSRQQASNERANQPINIEEHEEALELILFVIKKLSREGKRGWNKIPQLKNRLGLRLLYSIAAITKGKERVLTDILFPKKEITTSKDYLVLNIKNQNDY
jgi:hypothetical protein